MEKRNKKFFFIIIIAIIAVILIMLTILIIKHKKERKALVEYLSTFDDPVEDEAQKELKTTYQEIYSDLWICNFFYIDDAEHSSTYDENSESPGIYAEFTLINENDNLDDNILENMSEICNAVLTVADKYFGESYSSYPIEISFKKTNYDLNNDGIVIITYTDNGSTLRMYLQDSYATIKNIANTFPEINELSASDFNYDNIEDFEGFYNLRKIEIGNTHNSFANEEKEYILSVFPKCEIDDYLSSFDDPDEDEARTSFKEKYQEVYNEKWIYNYFSIIDSEHSPDFDSEIQEPAIEVSFTLKDENDVLDDDILDNISEISEAVYFTVKEYLYDKYSLYPIKIFFKTNNYDTDSDSMIRITYYGSHTTSKEMYIENSTVTVKKIASVFPDVAEFEVSQFYYDSIEDFNGFNRLWKLEIWHNQCAFTDEEKEYILSLYPGCEIIN